MERIANGNYSKDIREQAVKLETEFDISVP